MAGQYSLGTSRSAVSYAHRCVRHRAGVRGGDASLPAGSNASVARLPLLRAEMAPRAETAPRATRQYFCTIFRCPRLAASKAHKERLLLK